MQRDLYYSLETDSVRTFMRLYPDIYSKVDEVFEKLRVDDISYISSATIAKLNRDLENMDISSLPSDVSSQVEKPFRVSGHMVTMDLIPTNIGRYSHFSLEDWFDTHAMMMFGFLSFASPVPVDRFHNVELSFEQSEQEPKNRARATITRDGSLLVLGGITEAQIRVSIGYFVMWIRNAMRGFHKIDNLDVDIRNFRVNNYMVTGRMSGKVNTFAVFNDCVESNMVASFVPEKVNLTTIYPFPTAMPAARIRVYPAGGIVVLGCKTFSEVDLCVQFVLNLIRPHVRRSASPSLTSVSSSSTLMDEVDEEATIMEEEGDVFDEEDIGQALSNMKSAKQEKEETEDDDDDDGT